ncbi:MAG: DUF2973 domain-containing protein [Cyanobacteriota bacterium]|nr:DUF2973 domain-containing protein [Cyanobacteriota bacterium]
MWHIIYVVAFAVLAVLAIANLVRNLMLLGGNASITRLGRNQSTPAPTPHPELLDEAGRVIREPLLVMRSISVKDAREQLDALYNRSGAAGDEGNEGNVG